MLSINDVLTKVDLKKVITVKIGVITKNKSEIISMKFTLYELSFIPKK